jgi:hypothetical protein
MAATAKNGRRLQSTGDVTTFESLRVRHALR